MIKISVLLSRKVYYAALRCNDCKLEFLMTSDSKEDVLKKAQAKADKHTLLCGKIREYGR